MSFLRINITTRGYLKEEKQMARVLVLNAGNCKENLGRKEGGRESFYKFSQIV
jgi:hypothetical protein